MLTAALLMTAQTWKQLKYPLTEEWIMKMWYTIQWNITQMPFAATWIDLEIIILSEVTLREISHNVTYMWNLTKRVQINVSTSTYFYPEVISKLCSCSQNLGTHFYVQSKVYRFLLETSAIHSQLRFFILFSNSFQILHK